jgi:hypothetical protein
MTKACSLLDGRYRGRAPQRLKENPANSARLR